MVKFPKITPQIAAAVTVAVVIVAVLVYVFVIKSSSTTACTTNLDWTNQLPYCAEHKKCVQCIKASQCPTAHDCKAGICVYMSDGNEDKKLVCDLAKSVDRALCHNSLTCMYDTQTEQCVDRVVGVIKDCPSIKKDSRCRDFGGRCSWSNKKCVNRENP